MRLGLPEVLFFHTVAIQQYGGRGGIRDSGALEAAIARPWIRFRGRRDTYPTLFDKSAAICEAIIRNHPFVDGNKRTALSAGAYLLSTFGWEVDAQPSELEDVAVDVATGHMTLEDLSAWFEAHASKT